MAPLAMSMGLTNKLDDPVLSAATSFPPDPLPMLLANATQEDLTRRSDSPVATSPSKSSAARPSGSASVTSPVQIAPPSPLRDPTTGARLNPLPPSQIVGLQQNQGTGVRWDLCALRWSSADSGGRCAGEQGWSTGADGLDHARATQGHHRNVRGSPASDAQVVTDHARPSGSPSRSNQCAQLAAELLTARS